MDPPGTLQCELRPYQKQALHWMIQLEKGQCLDEAATTLHPCWEAYRLADKYVRSLCYLILSNLETLYSWDCLSIQEGAGCLFECIFR